MTVKEAAERAAESALLRGLARLSTLLLIPISLAFGSWIITSVRTLEDGIGNLSAAQQLAELRIANQEARSKDNVEAIRVITQRLLESDTARARSDEQIHAMRAALDRIERRLETALPR